MVISLTGCNVAEQISIRLNMLNSETINLETTENVLNSFSEKDKNALKGLFCEKTRGLEDIDEQILAGFDLFKGKVASFDDHIMAYEGSSIENGEITFLERAWNVFDIVTDEGKVYEFYIEVYVTYEGDKKREGISQITITSSDGAELKIGYGWPRYYSEGREMSYKVIKAFSSNDMDGLKSMFCTKTLEIADIDKQIQKGLSFFDGEATMGKVDDEYTVYDGSHDYRTFVDEHEIVKNSKPIRTSITVLNENIETDAGKIYKIEFNAYLLYTGDETYKGISQIIITSDDGSKQIIGKKID